MPIMNASQRLISVAVALTVILSACGQTKTKEQIARSESMDTWWKERAQEKERARQQQVAALRITLRDRSMERIASGNQAPTRVNEPGYPIADCVKPRLPDDRFTINTAIGIGDSLDEWGTNLICGNTLIGKKIVEWRQWYCQGSFDLFQACVLAKWEDSQPTFGPTVSAERKALLSVQGLGRVEIHYKPFFLQ